MFCKFLFNLIWSKFSDHLCMIDFHEIFTLFWRQTKPKIFEILYSFLQMCNGLEQPRKQQRSDLNGPADNNNPPEVGAWGCQLCFLQPGFQQGKQPSHCQPSPSHTHKPRLPFFSWTDNKYHICLLWKGFELYPGIFAASFILCNCLWHVLKPKIFWWHAE